MFVKPNNFIQIPKNIGLFNIDESTEENFSLAKYFDNV